MHEDVVDAALAWFAAHGRDLPWRHPDCTPWGVMVSEFMLQQTPVSRVLAPWQMWLTRWPDPSSLAAEAPGEAIRAWGRLGYPRRALRLHASAVAITERFDGQVPHTYADLRTLPGVGDYTAAAIASFAFGHRELVLDTNVRRVLSRLAGQPGPPLHATTAERARATDYLPDEPARAAVWAVASMEVGAMVCTARNPRCEACPLTEWCQWRALGYPGEPVRRTQDYEGTDRQCRGRILALLRAAREPMSRVQLEEACPDPQQSQRCLQGLLDDGLAVGLADGIALP